MGGTLLLSAEGGEGLGFAQITHKTWILAGTKRSYEKTNNFFNRPRFICGLLIQGWKLKSGNIIGLYVCLNCWKNNNKYLEAMKETLRYLIGIDIEIGIDINIEDDIDTLTCLILADLI